jgi:hypothetical protein
MIMRNVPVAIAVLRELFALSAAPVNRQASFCSRDVVRKTSARYVESNTAVGRELAVLQSHLVD